MALKKQKKLLSKIRTKFVKKPVVWSVLSVELVEFMALIVLGLTLYSQLMQSHPSKAAAETYKVPYATALPKIAQLAVSTLKTVTTLPTETPSQVTIAPSQIGTPKPEPVVTPSPNSSVSGLTPTTTTPSPGSQTPSSSSSSSPQTTTGYMSTNWSGYLATNASFTGISGSWTATDATGNGSTTSADATWIGIGGVTKSDLIQVGTENTIAASGKVSTSAFYELLPQVSQTVPGVTVSPGDSINASLSEVSSGQWTITITDKTDDESDTLSVSYNSSLSSAEWIEEDPSYSSGRQISFDNFNEAAFTDGSVILNGSPTTIAASTAQPLTMVNRSDQVIAAPSAIGSDGASFTVTP